MRKASFVQAASPGLCRVDPDIARAGELRFARNSRASEEGRVFCRSCGVAVFRRPARGQTTSDERKAHWVHRHVEGGPDCDLRVATGLSTGQTEATARPRGQLDGKHLVFSPGHDSTERESGTIGKLSVDGSRRVSRATSISAGPQSGIKRLTRVTQLQSIANRLRERIDAVIDLPDGRSGPLSALLRASSELLGEPPEKQMFWWGRVTRVKRSGLAFISLEPSAQHKIQFWVADGALKDLDVDLTRLTNTVVVGFTSLREETSFEVPPPPRRSWVARFDEPGYFATVPPAEADFLEGSLNPD